MALVRKERQKQIAKERIQKLFQEAEKEFAKHPERANRYVELARKIAMKMKIRMTEYRTKFCKHCYIYLKPGVNCRVRIKNKKVVYYCLSCKRYMKFPYLREKRGVRRAKKAPQN
ncbi:MAG: ribonuclease P protein component 4 [Candidatus Nanoarchaeia archaeon]